MYGSAVFSLISAVLYSLYLRQLM